MVQSALAMPNQSAWDTLVSHWLDIKSIDARPFDPNAPVHSFTIWPCSGSKEDYIVIRPKDMNDYLEVKRYHLNRLNYEDFARYARCYPGDPNYVNPPEPNLAEYIKESNDPNLTVLLKDLL